MVVNIAKNAGFCGGVHRAFVLTKKQFAGGNKNRKGRVLILGSLVHNENVMSRVEEWGIKKIKTMRCVQKGDTVIITAHGVGEQKIAALKEKGANVFDATCPFVSRVHEHVADYLKKDFEIIILGDKKHKEVKGINGWCRNVAKIVATEKEAEELAEKTKKSRSKKPILIVSQTTQNNALFDNVVKILKKAAQAKERKIEAINTICQATSGRQKEALNVSRKSDAVVIVGGKKSANTKQLWKIAKENNKRVIWIEDLNEQTKKSIKKGIGKAKSVGIIAGASTAKWDIDKVKNYLESL